MIRGFPNTARRGGFTLVEVLATLVLLAIILPVAMEGVSLATRTASQAKSRMIASSLAETTLNDIMVTEAWVEGDQSGDFEDWPGYEWHMQVADWEETSLKQVDVQVVWDSAAGERYVALSTLVYTEEQ